MSRRTYLFRSSASLKRRSEFYDRPGKFTRHDLRVMVVVRVRNERGWREKERDFLEN